MNQIFEYRDYKGNVLHRHEIPQPLSTEITEALPYVLSAAWGRDVVSLAWAAGCAVTAWYAGQRDKGTNEITVTMPSSKADLAFWVE